MAEETHRKRKRKNKASLVPWVVTGIVALLVTGIWAVSRGSGAKKSVVAADEVVSIVLPPPPTPTPPPKEEPPPPEEEAPPEEEEMLVQEEVMEDEQPPDEAPPELPSEDLSTGITGGNGPDLGLSSGNRNGRIGNNGPRRNASKYGWYAAKVQSTIADALRGNPKTRNARFSSLTVRIWADSSGRITRVQLVGTSGDPSIDQAIRSNALAGLQLTQGPPEGMPMPINLRIQARRPQS